MGRNLVAVFGILIGLAGLMLNYASHRHKVRQEAQENSLRAEQWRKIERDQEQEVRAQREQERSQASMIGGHISLAPSPLNESWVVPRVVVYNGSNQQVRNVRASFRGEVINEWPLVGTGHTFFPLPPTQLLDEHYDQLDEVTVEFTDAAGIRWRRDGYGALQRARQETDGHEVWEAPEPPVIGTGWSEPPPGSIVQYRMARRRRHFRFLMPTVGLVSMVLIAGSVWWLLR